jgi:ATP-dependent Lon protease
MTDAELRELLDFCVEGRKRVKDQLYIIDETFKAEPVDFSYTILATGEVVHPETLENQNYAAARQSAEAESTQESTAPTKESSTPPLDLKPHQTILKDNQTGVSFRALFADYLKGATSITLQDPYIRLPHQFRNLLEFCLMLANNKNPEDELALEVVTWNDEEHIPVSMQHLDEIQENLADLGITMTYRMEQHHDRFIAADNGWKITLGRGLDMFEKYEGRFNVASLDQTKRKCKACELTYLRI